MSRPTRAKVRGCQHRSYQKRYHHHPNIFQVFKCNACGRTGWQKAGTTYIVWGDLAKKYEKCQK